MAASFSHHHKAAARNDNAWLAREALHLRTAQQLGALSLMIANAIYVCQKHGGIKCVKNIGSAQRVGVVLLFFLLIRAAL